MRSAAPRCGEDQVRNELGAPRTVAVVGAGMVGLSTAWFLQEHGVEVTVLERETVAAGSSRGNAGWLTPSLSVPLPDPAVLRYGVRAVLSPSSPVYVPPSLEPRLIRFLAGFARHSTTKRWRRSMRALAPINRVALPAFDLLRDGGVSGETYDADPFLAAYRDPDERRALVAELEQVAAAGQEVDFELLSGEEAREREPALSSAVRAGLVVHGQRFIHPRDFVGRLADAVRSRGAEIREHTPVTAVLDAVGGARLRGPDGDLGRYDAVVVANGTWLNELARPFGVTTPVQAGRGYSFTVPMERVPAGPVYFPTQRVACTPMGERLQIAGMMEFRRPGAPLDPRRVRAIIDAAGPLFRGADLTDRQDEWVGSRPCTSDGLPLIGPTASPRVHVAGGHGMWGIVLGPATGRLLAEAVVTGRTPPELTPFDPLR